MLVVACATATTETQWPRQRSKLARTADGRVDLNAPVARTPDGRPDLSGIWEQYGEFEMPRYLLNQSLRLLPEDELIEHICEENNKVSPQVNRP
jgi:hypothetical protein